MTMESRQPEGAESNSDLVRSAAPSPADLWHEILERLNEVQEGQLKLARAIESLGVIVCDALTVSPQAALGGGETAALPRTVQRVPLAAGPSTPPKVDHLVKDADDPETTQRKVDALLDTDVFTPASPAPDMATTGAVTSPRFYVAPVPDESRKVPNERVSSGSWPRGRRVARGLAREAPKMTTPAIVPDLTPAAIDALLSAEFGDSPTAPNPPLRVVSAAEGGAALNTLLGAEFGMTTSTPTPTPTPTTAPPIPSRPGPASSRPTPPTPQSVRPPSPTPTPLSARPPMPTPTPSSVRPPSPTPESTRPLAPTGASPTTAPSMPPQPRVRQVPPTPNPVFPSSRPPVSPPQAGSSVPTVEPRRSVGPPPPAATAPPSPPAAPRPNPVAGPAPLVPPPVTSSGPPPSPGIPYPPANPSVSARPVTPDSSAGAPAPVEPRRAPLDAVTASPAPFVVPGGSTPDPLPGNAPTSTSTAAPLGAGTDGLLPPTKAEHSAASMMTEILSAAPHAQVAEPTETAPTMLAEDVTIMAKGRRRRFRLR
jgi:hypothetical protein